MPNSGRRLSGKLPERFETGKVLERFKDVRL